jgi:aspartyl-tRNA(Asn)/glutamyl-tRNA(Gln) amidotransferase subunit B
VKAPAEGAAPAGVSRGPSAQERAELAAWTDAGVSVETARTLKADPALDRLAWDTVRAGVEPRDAAHLAAHEVVRALDGRSADALPFGGPEAAALVVLMAQGTLNQNGLREVLGELVRSGGDPAEIVARRGLVQLGQDALTPVIAAVLADHPDEAARLAAGETKLVGFLLGQVMRRTRGKADPKAARELLLRG